MKIIVLLSLLVGCGFTIEGGSNGTAIDAPDASIDSAEHDAQPDAPCTPQSRELLVNGAFDTTPAAWIESAPIITDQGTVASETAPNKAWLGGTLAITHVLYQDIVIPPDATMLVLAGKFQVRTLEPATSVRDTARIDLEGSPIALFELDNRTPTTTWETFVVPINASGTRRLTISATNDEALVTSFYFDSLSFTAMVCP